MADRRVLLRGARMCRVVVFACGLLAAADARAQVDADFSAYCRQNFPGSQPEKTEHSRGIQHNCNQGGTRQGIDLGEACRLTTGSPSYRELGDRVICTGEEEGTASAPQGIAGPLDLAAHCRDAFPNSTPETRFEPRGIKHYCRQTGTTGGFTRQPIDLAAACLRQRGVEAFIEAGTQVLCGSLGIAGLGQGNPGGGGGAGGRGFPPLKPDDVIDAGGSGDLTAKPVKFVNLQSCGNADPDFRITLPPTAMRRGIGDQIFDYMGLTMSCPGLTGGRVVEFQKVCNEFRSARPPMEARLLPEGLPICWKVGRRGWPPDLRAGEAGWGLNGVPLTGVCNEAYHGHPPTGQELRESNVTSLLKYEAGSLQVECFYIRTDELVRLLRE